MEIDECELEKQRYDAIKKSDKYLEVTILVSSESEETTEETSTVPVIRVNMNNCTGFDVGYTYLALKHLSEDFMKNYPKECLYAEFTTDYKNLGMIGEKDED